MRSTDSLAVLRVIGPAGSGKSSLIITLAQMLGIHGHRVSNVSQNRLMNATVVTLSNDARVTVEGLPSLDEIARLARSVDPSADLLLAEAYDDGAYPAVAMVPRGAPRPPSTGLLATVDTEALAASFARGGPGAGTTTSDRLLATLVAKIERDLLGVEARPASIASRLASMARGLLGR